MDRDDGLALAHHLGRALQLTNILRDLDEDAAIGRLYLPREALQEAGIASTDPAEVLAHPNLGRACATIVALAEKHFDDADAIMARNPRRAVKAPRIMAAAYRPRLALMVERGWAAPRERVSIGRLDFLWILLRYAIV
jgi:phytoene synthase